MTTSKLLIDRRDATTLFTRLTDAAQQIWIATAWASDATPMSRALARVRSRIAALAVGLDFHQTDPDFLDRFRAHARVREVEDGTFHPKVYVFRTGSKFDAIVGSANLTRGGFGPNLELDVHLHGVTSDRVFRELVAFVEAQADAGRQMLAEDVAHYRKAWKAHQKPLKAARTYVPRKRLMRDDDVPLHVPWATFVERLFRTAKRAGHAMHPRGEDLGYLGVIGEAARIFRKYGRLAEMPLAERKKVAGIERRYGYFGSMRGAGHFKEHVAKRPAKLDRALDEIPSKGAVTREAFDAYAKAMAALEGVGVAVATRLLAMKRPDQFLCIDSANRRALSQAFGIAQSELNTYDGYWNLLTIAWRCPWCKAPRPKVKHAAVWDARVALVDAFYYGA